MFIYQRVYYNPQLKWVNSEEIPQSIAINFMDWPVIIRGKCRSLVPWSSEKLPAFLGSRRAAGKFAVCEESCYSDYPPAIKHGNWKSAIYDDFPSETLIST